MIKYKSAKTLEDIPNNSICVLTYQGIRKMKHPYDIENYSIENGQLVYVSNTTKNWEHQDEYDEIIKKDGLARYVDIEVRPKQHFEFH